MSVTAASEFRDRAVVEAERGSTSHSMEPQETSAGERLTISIRHADRGCLVTLGGELDTASAGGLTDTLAPWARTCRRLTLDLRDVSFLDSAGLRAILDLYRSLRAREVSLHLIEGEQGNVGHVLRTAGLESLIVHSDESPVG